MQLFVVPQTKEKAETVKIKTAPKKASTQSNQIANNRNKGKNNYNQNRNKGKNQDKAFSNILHLKRRRKKNCQQKLLLVNH